MLVITPLSVLFFLMVQCLLMAHPHIANAIESARHMMMSLVYSELNFVSSSAMTSALAAAAEDIERGRDEM